MNQTGTAAINIDDLTWYNRMANNGSVSVTDYQIEVNSLLNLTNRVMVAEYIAYYITKQEK